MSNASLKEQLQAVASQLSDTVIKVSDNSSGKDGDRKPKKPFRPVEKASRPNASRPDANRLNNSASNNKPKPKWLDYVQYGVELLKAYFPATFKTNNDVKPLKKGIKQDLVLRLSTLDNIVTDDKACMVKSLAFYVNTAAYHRSVVEGATRIDLDGNAAGLVTAEEAKYSVDRHQSKLQAKQEAKNAAALTTPEKETVTP